MNRTAAETANAALIDPAVLMAIANLELRARIVVEGLWSGMHRSPLHGFSVEFTEYRPYTVGDDPRFIDWRLLARSDRLYLKKFQDETNLRCHFLLDHSRSMTFGSRGYSKAQYANTLAASLAYFLHLQGDAVGLLTFDEAIREYLPARNRPGHLRHLMLLLEKPAQGVSTDLAAPLDRILQLVHKRGLMLLVSDLLAPLDGLQSKLRLLTASGHEVLLFHVLDPAEVTLSFDRAVRFEDVESGDNLFIDPETARAGYQRRFQAHNAAAEQMCHELGIAYTRLTTDRPLHLALFDFLRARAESTAKHHPIHHRR